jgi:hypothetical protein
LRANAMRDYILENANVALISCRSYLFQTFGRMLNVTTSVKCKSVTLVFLSPK